MFTVKGADMHDQASPDATTGRFRPSLLRRWRDRNHPIYLALSLLLLLIAQPIINVVPFAQCLILALFTLVLISAMLSVIADRKQFAVLCVLVLPLVMLTWLSRLVEVGFWAIVGANLMFVAFLLYLIVLMLKRILAETVVTGNTLIRAVSIYLMLGIAWAFVYHALEWFDPQAISLLEADSPWADFAYFSFTTMTTLGYGDIVPLSPMARSLVMLQAVLGPLYLTILVAKLVAAYRMTVHEDGPRIETHGGGAPTEVTDRAETS
jgi:hypothetical protein